jgi:hypothetical protein
MGKKKTETTTTRKSERLAAANAAAAAAAFNPAAAAAATAASPTATANDALPPAILEGRFEGYMSPGYVEEMSREKRMPVHYQELCRRLQKSAFEDFAQWQDEEIDKLPEHLMRRQKMLKDRVNICRCQRPKHNCRRRRRR